jgi:nucleoside-diphosphate-sugar epimerase
MTARQVLIAGASGVVGRAALDAFGATPGWDALGVSRRAPDVDLGRHMPLDLLDPQACAAALRAGPSITHVVYCALQERPGLVQGWLDRELMQTNRRMLEGLLDALAPQETLEHVSLLQGAKAYGAHQHPMRVPGREHEARDPHENFYWLQEDLLRERAAREDFRFTIWRPPIVFGHAIGAPMNVLAAIGTFAAISKAEGSPLCWPGGATAALDGVDARLLAQAFLWASDAPEARNQVFNISNGDVFVWENVWGSIAEAMGMAVGEPGPQRLSQSLPPKAGVWDELVVSQGLRAPELMQLVGDSYVYLDLLFNAGGERPPPASLLSTIKLRRAGFQGCVDSEDMIIEWLRWLQQQRILPAA